MGQRLSKPSNSAPAHNLLQTSMPICKPCALAFCLIHARALMQCFCIPGRRQRPSDLPSLIGTMRAETVLSICLFLFALEWRIRRLHIICEYSCVSHHVSPIGVRRYNKGGQVLTRAMNLGFSVVESFELFQFWTQRLARCIQNNFSFLFQHCKTFRMLAQFSLSYKRASFHHFSFIFSSAVLEKVHGIPLAPGVMTQRAWDDIRIVLPIVCMTVYSTTNTTTNCLSTFLL